MNETELKLSLELHEKWLRGQDGGVRANLSGADLSGANLSGANLSGADLRRADLSGADLSGANLSDADLSDADLSDANLSGANLSDADLSGANLSDADLSDANLSGANLSDADLSDADLRRADLSDADLSGAKEDFFKILNSAPNEVAGLLEALNNGKVDGSTYSGECCCLVGTIANVRGCSYDSLIDIQPDSNRPAEKWFMAISEGNTPLNHPAAKITAEWIEEWQAANPVTTKSTEPLRA